MKKFFVAIAILVISIVLSASLLIADQYLSNKTSSPQETHPFYVGVSYGGDNVTEAKLLIDEVKNYTNLFVLSSGPLQHDVNSLNEICAYAANSGLHIIVYFGANEYTRQFVSSFLDSSKSLGDNLLGIYYDDEPGGKMLDATVVDLHDVKTNSTVTRWSTNSTAITQTDGTRIVYQNDGYVYVSTPDDNYIVYQPNGSVQVTVNDTSPTQISYRIEPNGVAYLLDGNGNAVLRVNDTSILPNIKPIDNVLAEKPLTTYADTEERFVDNIKSGLSWLHGQTSLKVFTSDYGLYWYDYLGGYDAVFAELGWNNTETQQIGLVRGAADIEGKDWGAIITWKYTQPPYLASGDEIFDQMRMSYECGADYIVLFNYAQDMSGAYGTLQSEHFWALEQFWNNIVNNSTEIHGGVRADAALVLPQNYGWGMRSPADNIWGIWSADSISGQVWSQLQSKLTEYGSRLDIIYEDHTSGLTNEYSHVYYWDQ